MKNILFILLIVTLFSCNRSEHTKDNITIGFSASTEVFLQERWKRDLSIFTARAKEFGAEVILFKSSKESDDQLDEIKQLLKEDIDVLVVIPRNRTNLNDVISRVMAKGIPVLSYDRLILNTPVSGYISFDNQEVGQHMAKQLLEVSPKGNYLVINGSVYDNNSYEVNLGVHKILDPEIKSGNINLIDEFWLNEWSYDEAFKRFTEFLNQYEGELHAVSCANDMIAQAVIKVLAENRLAGQVKVVGQDADLSACQSIIDETQLMTVYKPLHNLAKRAADLAIELARGEEPEPDLYINNSSDRSIPYFIENTIPVTLENIKDTVLKDGFHSYEDIYRE